MPGAAPYRPPDLDPGLARLGWSLGRLEMGGFKIHQTPAALEYLAGPPAPWPAVAAFGLEAGGFNWTVELGDLAPVRLHPALFDLDLKALPEPFRLAALDWAFRPLWEGLGKLLDAEVSPIPASGAAETEGVEFRLRLVLASGESRSVPLRLKPENTLAAQWLAGALEKGRPRKPARNMDRLPLNLSLAAGRMAVKLKDLAGLAPGDILLPPDYPAARGRLYLDLPGGRRTVILTLAEGRATVAEISNIEERPEAGEAAPAGEPGPETQSPPPVRAGAPDDLELTVSFELERRTMTLGELSELVPGAVFPLGVDPGAPVTLRVNGRAVARARLVSLGESLGLQVTDLADGPGRD